MKTAYIANTGSFDTDTDYYSEEEYMNDSMSSTCTTIHHCPDQTLPEDIRGDELWSMAMQEQQKRRMLDIRAEDERRKLATQVEDENRVILARNTVLNLPELILKIFLYLAQDRYFHRIGQVCCKWRHVYTKSHQLQRTRLFTANNIVDNLLGLMGMKDILNAQQVCRAWNAIIARNYHAQHTMFLEAAIPSTTLNKRRTLMISMRPLWD